MIQTLLKIIICSRHWLHPFWDILGPSWAMSGLCWSNADAILTHLRPIYPILGLSWDPFGPIWAYLGLLGAILSHPRGILGPRASKLAPAARDRVPGSPSWVLLGSIRGSILGSDRPKRGQDGPKRTIKRCKIPKTRICKNLEKTY